MAEKKPYYNFISYDSYKYPFGMALWGNHSDKTTVFRVGNEQFGEFKITSHPSVHDRLPSVEFVYDCNSKLACIENTIDFARDTTRPDQKDGIHISVPLNCTVSQDYVALQFGDTQVRILIRPAPNNESYREHVFWIDKADRGYLPVGNQVKTTMGALVSGLDEMEHYVQFISKIPSSGKETEATDRKLVTGILFDPDRIMFLMRNIEIFNNERTKKSAYFTFVNSITSYTKKTNTQGESLDPFFRLYASVI
ncbi:hypothetical protein HGA88_04835 [Candidatus Roizmanbacteria bacterium]|nr:hypothetical protein [Candidatus Roizmanbacteria bacterium]